MKEDEMPTATLPETTIIEARYLLQQLRQQLAEVTAERDLFRTQWLQLKYEMAQVMRMTRAECDELLKTGVDGQVVLAEMEEILK